MKKFYLVLFALLAGVALASCSIDDDDDGSTPSSVITGIFESDHNERFEITMTTFTNKYKTSHNDYNTAYEGTVAQIPQGYNATGSGIIYIKYTRAMYSDNTYGEHAPDVGKYYAIAYKDLTTGFVKLSAAYKRGGATSCSTLQEAKMEFTEANGYFADWSECTRVRE